MAKKEEKPKVELERTYNIPLRKGFQKAPMHKRAKRAVSAVKKFLERHMKSDNIKIGKFLNEKIWERGIKRPPHHVKVVAKKDSEGVVTAELVGAPKEEIKKPKKEIKEKPKEIAKEEKPEVGKKEEAKEEKPEQKKEEKPEEKLEEMVEKKKEEPEKEKLTKEEIEKRDAKGPKEVEVPKAEELAKKREEKK